MGILDLVTALLTAVLFLDSVVLVLVILVQLPKKDAGPGVAFGGGAADALFGAGTGNALTQITKWGAVLFLILALVLTALNKKKSQKLKTGIDKALAEQTVGEGADSVIVENDPDVEAEITPEEISAAIEQISSTVTDAAEATEAIKKAATTDTPETPSGQ